MNEQVLLLLQGVISCWIGLVASHGRLWDPVARNAAWRRGFKTPINYNDVELFCGGLKHLISQGYKCGLCGDPYDSEREHETGGKYATGTITKTYKQGQKINISVDLTAAHKGWFEFKLCPRHNSKIRETQRCFDSNVLALADGSGTKFYIDKNRMYNIEVQLPEDVRCKFCVLQWRYHAGNNWGTDPDGQSGLGLGHQEEFYNCADISIIRPRSVPNKLPASGSGMFRQPTLKSGSFRRPTLGFGSFRRPTLGFGSFRRPTLGSGSFRKPTVGSGSFIRPASFRKPSSFCSVGSEQDDEKKTCRATSILGTGPGHDKWCVENCNLGYCPKTYCQCD